MSDSPPSSAAMMMAAASDDDSRAVCPYDGRCYRKNPQHFRDYRHPAQLRDSPGVVTTGTSSFSPRLDFPTTPKRTRTEGGGAPLPPPPPSSAAAAAPPMASSHSDRCMSVATTEVVCDVSSSSAYTTPRWTPPMLQDAPSRSDTQAPSPVRVSVMAAEESGVTDAFEALEREGPSTDLLRQLVVRDPHPQAVDAVGCGADSKEAAPLLTASLLGVGKCLAEAYHMPFVSADIRAVLLAAMKLHPADPLRAFPGWRLVGPMELLWRIYCSSQTVGGPEGMSTRPLLALSSSSPPPSASSFFLDEAAKWRCARFRYDPPECMTVAVCEDDEEEEEKDEEKDKKAAGTRKPGTHLCYHRDDPQEVPSMVVLGTAAEATFDIVAPSVTAYLMSSAHDAGRQDVVQALRDALRVVVETKATAADKSSNSVSERVCALLDETVVPSCSALASRSSRHRKRQQLAATFHGLGIQAPYNADTEMGYRPLTMKAKRLRQVLESWDADYASKARAIPPTVDEYNKNNKNNAGDDTVKATSMSSSTAVTEQRAFSAMDWEEIHEQFRYADMANDEGDFALNLELGLNILAAVRAPSFVPHHEDPGAEGESITAKQESEAEGEEGSKARCNPLLWHSFRVLDCAYMLLDRPLYRHVLRCHIPLLAGQSQVLLRCEEVFASCSLK